MGSFIRKWWPKETGKPNCFYAKFDVCEKSWGNVIRPKDMNSVSSKLGETWQDLFILIRLQREECFFTHGKGRELLTWRTQGLLWGEKGGHRVLPWIIFQIPSG